jgi:hypothetical protein
MEPVHYKPQLSADISSPHAHFIDDRQPGIISRACVLAAIIVKRLVGAAIVPVTDAPPATVITPIEQVEAFVAATGAPIHHGGARAFYRPSTDSIQLPPREAFTGTPTQLWLILGDGVNQAADLALGATSIPSWNLTPWMTFGNWF